MAISWTDNDATVTINMPSPLGEVFLTSASTTITVPTVQVKATGSYLEAPFRFGIARDYTLGTGWYDYGTPLVLKYGSTELKELRGNTTSNVAKNTYSNVTYYGGASATLYASNYFNSSNSTTRSVNLSVVAPKYCTVWIWEPTYGGSSNCENPSEKTLSTIKVTLDVPPTATVSPISFDTPYVYAGLTTASVTVSSVSAKYGGTITEVKLTIGNQTASISGNGTLSILLNASGTFTPVVTITDSRGQVKDYPLDDITVGTYSTPTVNFDAERTTNTGVLDDEGAYATIVTTLTFDPIAEAVAPSVTVTDEDGNAQTIDSITWYSTRNGALSGVISDWSTVASGSTVYGLISITGDFDTQKSYVISLTPQDSEGITGDTKTDTLQTAFYTVDFLAGGHGIAFGQPSSQDGFYCNMDANFMENVLIDLPDYQTTGTTDKAIYDAVVALGWDSDVIV